MSIRRQDFRASDRPSIEAHEAGREAGKPGSKGQRRAGSAGRDAARLALAGRVAPAPPVRARPRRLAAPRLLHPPGGVRKMPPPQNSYVEGVCTGEFFLGRAGRSCCLGRGLRRKREDGEMEVPEGLNARDAAMFRDMADRASAAGAVPGMVVAQPSPIVSIDALPNVGIIGGLRRDRAFEAMAKAQALVGLPINPEPIENLDYWVWVSREPYDQAEWFPARYMGGSWWPTWRRGGLSANAVRFWRGPMVPPEAPTPAQVDALNRQVHDATDLEVSG